MAQDDFSRREWLALWAAGLVSVWSEVAAAHEHAQRVVSAGAAGPFGFFDEASASEVEAICAQIVPTDDTPGAREAGVIYFIDRALTTFEKERQDAYRHGLADLQTRRAVLFPGSTSIAALPPDQQLALVTGIDGTPFFEMVRTHTMLGFFGSPDRGGNRDLLGWRLLGIDGHTSYRPPFGFYDAQAVKEDIR